MNGKLYVIQIRPVGAEQWEFNPTLGYFENVEAARAYIAKLPNGNPECRIAEFWFKAFVDAPPQAP